MKKVLTIAGSDSSGGAGIQADIKTITAHKLYAMSAITALTAQNTTGVSGVLEVSSEFVTKQIDSIFSDIIPDAVKIGMVSNAGIIKAIAEKLLEYKASNIVVDPVMIATSGSKLLNDNAVEALKAWLLPLAVLITPNIPEAESLCGFKIKSKDEMQKAARLISHMVNSARRVSYYAAMDSRDTGILIKGGHFQQNADDLLYHKNEFFWFEAPRINNPNTHGTGCTLSSAIACGLATGKTLNESIQNAKAYITGALLDGLDIGKGSGPLNHCYKL